MVDVENIISQIDKFLKISGKSTTTPVEIGSYLDSKGVLNDSVSKPGLPVRRLLRKGNIPHAYQPTLCLLSSYLKTNISIYHLGEHKQLCY